MDINAMQGQIRTSTLNNVKKAILMAVQLKKYFSFLFL